MIATARERFRQVTNFGSHRVTLETNPSTDVRAGSVRYMLSGLLGINLFLLYAMRLTLSVSITFMVNSTNAENGPNLTTSTCVDPHHVVNETVIEPPKRGVCCLEI